MIDQRITMLLSALAFVLSGYVYMTTGLNSTNAQGVQTTQGGAMVADWGTGQAIQFWGGTVRSGGQTTDLGIGDHFEYVEFASEGNITVSTGAGQLAGIITLPPNGKYYLIADLAGEFTNSVGFIEWTFHDLTNNVQFGTQPIASPKTTSLNIVNPAACVGFIVTGDTAIDIEVRIAVSSNVSELFDDTVLTIVDLA